MIGLVGSTLVVTSLATDGAPEAGRLTALDSGYGATTTIGYLSAKTRTDHPVPFPEIVVGAVATADTRHFGGHLAGTRYAYGNGALVFDSTLDRFAFPGYQRRVEVALFESPNDSLPRTGPDRTLGSATITDAWPRTPFNLGLTKAERWLRLQRTGRPRDLFTLRGSTGLDPWTLLGVDVNDTRVVGVRHFEWMAKLFEEPTNPAENVFDCVDMNQPLDFAQSVAGNFGINGLDLCRVHGFAYKASATGWYGASAPPSSNNIQTQSSSLAVDDFGRVTLASQAGDVFRSDDDFCVASEFAQPAGHGARVLTALAARRITNCDRKRRPITFASEAWTYDGLAAGSVGSGRVSSHTVDRRASDSGALLRTFVEFDASYDALGNPASVRTRRDGDARTASFAYDAFGLVPISASLAATGLPSTTTLYDYDPLSLDAVGSTDANLVVRSVSYDGYGRVSQSTVATPGGTPGVVSSVVYRGFDNADPNGRQVVVTEFADPVPPADLVSANGRTGTTFLDELGRTTRKELALGSDYANELLVVDATTYDGLGRIAFEADPYPKSQASAPPYGTTYLFKTTGDINCVIRGRGRQTLSATTDAATERFPTCFQRSFDGHVDTIDMQDAASLDAASPQAGVVKRLVSSATGRALEASTLKNGTRLEHATFAHDRLGRRTAMTRFLDPVGATNPVAWAWRLDSLGQTLQLIEPQNATRTTAYSDWGEAVETQWTEGGNDRRVARSYDALGRVARVDERVNGVVDPESINSYAYDNGVAVSPQVTPTFVIGQLARASSPSGDVAYSYDALGLVNAQTFTDGRGGAPYVEKFEHHADGSLASLEFNLPDQNHAHEVLKYGYDLAGRLRAIAHSDPTGSLELYRAEGIDAWGRVRKARYGGKSVYVADYAADGQRLIKEAGVEFDVRPAHGVVCGCRCRRA